MVGRKVRKGRGGDGKSRKSVPSQGTRAQQIQQARKIPLDKWVPSFAGNCIHYAFDKTAWTIRVKVAVTSRLTCHFPEQCLF